MRRMITLLSLCALAITLGAAPALAVPMLKFDDGSNPAVVITDGVAGFDINPVTGAVTFLGSVGNFLINVSTGVTKPVLGSASAPHLDLNSVDVTGWGPGGQLTISFTETGFAPLAPALTSYTSTIGGVVSTGGTLTYNTYLDASNAAFGMGTSLGSQAFTSGPFSGAFSLPDLLVSSTYSLTQVLKLTHSGSWQTSSFNAELQAVPEPASLVLFGTGLVTLAAMARRRLRKRTS